MYRKRLPRYAQTEIANTGYGGIILEAIYFEHATRRGVFVLLLLGIIGFSLGAGIWISVVKKDLSAGFTVAAYASLPLAAVVGLWNSN